MSYDNPYAPSASAPQFSNTLRLADVGKRFVGFLIDSLVGFVAVVPGYVMIIADSAGRGGDFESGMNNSEIGPLGIVGLILIIVASIALLIAQVYLLAVRSQTIGKLIMKMQIVDIRTGQPADFVHAFLLRSLVNGIIINIPCVGFFYMIADACYIFRQDRRCIHDHLASTCVVDIS